MSMRLLSLTLALGLLVPVTAWAQAEAPSGPSPGKLELQLPGVYRAGKERIAFAGQKLTIRGTVSPAIAGENVEVVVRRGRKIVRRVVVDVVDGTFGVAFRSHKRGTLTISAHHAATAAQVEMDARPLRVGFVKAEAHQGGKGVVVRFLQARLAALHYMVPRSGRYDDGTARAVLAYRKVNRMSRKQSVSRKILLRLAAGKGAFHPRYPGRGRHVEADLKRQVLVLIGGKNKVYRVIHMSSGKPSTPTVRGTFHFYQKSPGTNAKGMLDSNYFIRGYAIHGYPDVPNYAASHGCLRIPNANAAFVFGWVRIGDEIDVYR
jgi:hypothetical protein